jgi:hypothetical protein
MSECISQAPARSSVKMGKLFLHQEEKGMLHASLQQSVQRKVDFFPAVQTLTEDADMYETPDVQAFFMPFTQRSVQRRHTLQEPSSNFVSRKLESDVHVQLLCAECEEEMKLQRSEEEEADIQSKEEEIKKKPAIQKACEHCEEEEEIHRDAETETEADEIQENVQREVTEKDQRLVDSAAQVQRFDASAQDMLQPKAVAQPAPFLQASLKVGAPNDPYEHEADQMGEKVMRLPLISFTGGGGVRPGGNNNTINRQEEDNPDEVKMKPVPGLQRSADGGLTTSPLFATRMKSSLGGGEPLPSNTRIGMESAFNADFTGVRIHSGSNAAALSSEIGAQAFTYQDNIFFNEHKYNPDSSQGRFLLAHELTHTVQQGACKTVQRDPEPDDAPTEEESWLDKLKKGFDYTLQLLLPAAIYNIYTKIKSGGLLSFFKDTIVGLFKGLFGKLGFSEEEIVVIFQVFAALKSQIPAIIEGLSNNDCKPLFAALHLLSDVLGTIAGRIWDNLMAKLEPVRLWLIDIWNTFGAPVIDAITTFFGEQWELIKSFGKWIWNNVYKPIIAKGKAVWDWVVKKLGFGSDDEPGLMAWVSNKLSDAWQSIKKELKPVIDPINDVITGIKSLVSLEAIKKMQEDAKKWLDEVVKTATAMGSDEDAVANKQLTLRSVLLPALNKAIDRLKGALRSAGDWVMQKVSFVTENVGNFISGLQGNTYLRPFYSLVKWIPNTTAKLKDWAADKVNWLFDKIQLGVDHLRKFVEPLITLLEKLVSVVGNLLKYLPDLILGVPFMFMPRCIKDPIIKWLTEVVLKQIPIISEFIGLIEKWEQIKTAALTVLKQVFLDGQFARGLWTYFKMLLEILGIDPQLVVKVVAKAAQNFSDIIMKPVDFFKNVWTAIKGGFNLFFDNILIHLPKGALDWLFGEVKGAVKVAPPKDFSVGSILGYILELFGISLENVYDRMTKHPRIGAAKVAIIRKIEKTVTGVLEWVSVWINEGPQGLLRKAKEKIGDLKDMVIQGVVSWITKSITAEILKRLATSADPLGIGATINTIKLVYDTMKTAVAYINRMLNMINSVLDSIAEIIAGNTKAASEYLESVLAKAVPFVIGFAVEVIIGPVGDKIKEIVTDVRLKVDEAIDWLINGALSLIDTLANAAKGIIEDIKGLLGLEKKFKAENKEEHRLYFTGDVKSPVLMVASNTPKTFRAFLESLPLTDADAQKIKNKNAAGMLAGKVDGKKATIAGLYAERDRVKKSQGDTTAVEEKINKEKDEVKELLDQISEKISPLFTGEDIPTGSSNDPIPVTWYKPPGKYERSITLDGMDGPETFHFGREDTFYFPKEGYQVKYTFPDPNRENKDKKEERKAKNRLSVIEKTFIELGGSSAYIPKQNKHHPIKMSGSYRGALKSGPQKTFRKILSDHGYNFGGKDADHVLDLQFQGIDDYSNMWPLEESINRSALSFLNQGVLYKAADGKTRAAPLGASELNGKYFYVKDYQLF